MKIFIDLETYASVDLKSAGVYNYVKSQDFKILLLAYSVGSSDEVIVIDFLSDFKDKLEKFKELYFNEKVQFIAHNANFERLCLNEFLGVIPASRYTCTMAMCAYSGIAHSLNLAAAMLDLPVKKKIVSGNSCMTFFCKPNKKGLQNLPETNPALWDAFIDYVTFDVLVTLKLYERLPELPKKEKDIWLIDSLINDLGVKADVDFVKNAVRIDAEINQNLHLEAQRLGIENLNSRDQLLSFFEKHGVYLKDLSAKTVSEVLQDEKSNLPKVVKELLQLKQSCSKSSTKKFTSIVNRASADGRVRGMFMYYGAHTGRWASRGVQLQNMPGSKGYDIEKIRLSINDDTFLQAQGNIKDPIAGCIRTSFIPEEGKILAVIDYSAIEARVLSWLADEAWRLKVFNETGAIYEASASRMFGIPIDQVTKGSQWRQLGKVAELALGYQGGFNSLYSMSKACGVPIAEAQGKEIVQKWRSANSRIVDFWNKCQQSVILAIEGKKNFISEKLGIYSVFEDNFLNITLPSGRAIRYYNAAVLRNPRQIPNIGELSRLLQEYGITDYNSLVSASKIKSEAVWRKNSSLDNYNMSCLADLFEKMLSTRDDLGYKPLIIYTAECVGGIISPQKNIKVLYGGNICNNITQAVARDILAESMLRLAKHNYIPIMQVHDELVFEISAENADAELKKIESLMVESPDWGVGLPLSVEGGLTKVYKKL